MIGYILVSLAIHLTERGRCKYKCTRRKVVWSKIEDIVLGEYAYHAAIDIILDHYGKEKMFHRSNQFNEEGLA